MVVTNIIVITMVTINIDIFEFFKKTLPQGGQHLVMALYLVIINKMLSLLFLD